jgi:RNA polymerase sigma-70 factor (ECF subfamily)
VQHRPDEELVVAAQAGADGDTSAFDALVRRHQGGVLANCRYLTRSADDSEDLAQEVFVKAFFALPRFEARASFKTWLHRIKVNHCMNFLSRRKKHVLVDVEDPSLVGEPDLQSRESTERRVEARSDRERIEQILDSLTETLRVPLVLRDVDGMAYGEIADLLGIRLSAVKMRIKRGREEFRRQWDEDREEVGRE